MRRITAWFASGVEGLSTIAVRLAGLAVFAMMILITFDVAYRFVFGGSTMLAEEGGGFLLLMVVFLPAADLMRRGGHIVIDLIVRRVPDTTVGWLRLMTYVLALGYVTIFLWQAVVFQGGLATVERKSLVLLFPFRFVQPFMIAGLALLWLMLLVITVRHVRALLAPSTVDERQRMLRRAHGAAGDGLELHAE